jgi:hypothetical protein
MTDKATIEVPAAVAASAYVYQVFEAPTTGADGRMVAGALKRTETIAEIYREALELGLLAVCKRLADFCSAETVIPGDDVAVMGFAKSQIAIEKGRRA